MKWIKHSYGLLVIAQENVSLSTDTYHVFLEGSDGFLDSNFDATKNVFSILGQIYLRGKTNKEVTLKEMHSQPEKEMFDQAMYDEVKAMFGNVIGEKVSIATKNAYHDGVRKSGTDMKRGKYDDLVFKM